MAPPSPPAREWETWFGALMPPAPLRPMPQAALAYRHNLKSLLMPLYVSLSETKDGAQRARVLPFVTKALGKLD